VKICSIYTCKLDLYGWSTHLFSRGGSEIPRAGAGAGAGGIKGEPICEQLKYSN